VIEGTGAFNIAYGRWLVSAHYIALLTISPAQGDIVGREYIKLSGVTSVAPCQFLDPQKTTIISFFSEENCILNVGLRKVAVNIFQFMKFIFLTTYSLTFQRLVNSAEKFVRAWSEK
jgi:hypothetical protein